MRNPFTTDRSTPVDSQILAILDEMEVVGVHDEKYPKLMDHLKQLNEMKTKTRRPPVSADTVALCLSNLAGILIIVIYEQKHVLTSKGFTERIRPKGFTNTP